MEFPSPATGGWGSQVVNDGTYGGYQWQVYFLSNPGATDGLTFPPGSGNIDPIMVSSDPSSLFGTSVSLSVATVQDGSTPIDGTFTLTYNGSQTDPIYYDQQPLETKYLLQALDTIGTVDVASENSIVQQIPGVFVTAERDSSVLTVVYDRTNPLTPGDIREALNPGDLIRVGGNGNAMAYDGASPWSLVNVLPGSPILQILDPNAAVVLPGEEIRIGFDNYTVQRTGIEIQVISLTCDSLLGDCGFVDLSFYHNGIQGAIPPIFRSNGGNMTTAAELLANFELLSSLNIGDVYVTRTDSIDGYSFYYKVYFEGPGALGDVNQIQANGTCIQCTISIYTLIEGGFTEVQQIRMVVDSGYIEGPFVSFAAELNGVSYSTVCLAFGLESADLTQALQSLVPLNHVDLPFSVTIISSFLLRASSSIFGILQVGDNITLGSNLTLFYPITNIFNGTYLEIYPSATQTLSAGSTGVNIGLVTPSAVIASRKGTGNSTMELISLTTTADSYVISGAGGFYRIAVTFAGIQRTSYCLDFHAAAADMESAIDNLGFDFNGDGVYSTADYGHVMVNRQGDGSASSGYGYVYTFRFSGPALAFGRSDVMGASSPVIEVLDEGHFGGCFDLGGVDAASILIDARLSNGMYNWTTYNGLYTEGIIQPGDRLRVPNSVTPNQTYTVIATDGQTRIIVDGALQTTAASFVTAYVFVTAIPSFIVEVLQSGEDSYSYEVAFTGPQLSTVPLLNGTICPNFYQVDGMRYGLAISVLQMGGSAAEEGIFMRSISTPLFNTSGAFWKLIYFTPTSLTILPTGPGYTYAVDPSTLQSSIATISELANVTVIRNGTGSPEDNYGFTYTITVPEVLNNGPMFQVLLQQQVSRPLFIPGNLSEPRHYLNDLTVHGSYSGNADTLFYIEISAVAILAMNITHDSFRWRSSLNASYSMSLNISSGQIYLQNGLSVSFGSIRGHALNDHWVFAAVYTADALPIGASIVYGTIRSGAPSTQQLVLSSGYLGQIDSSTLAYKINPIFAVASQDVPVFKLITKNSTLFAIRADNYGGMGLNSSTTTCFSWDINDYDLESILNALYSDVCGTMTPCITVTQGTDPIYNYGGYDYLIYFEHPSFSLNVFSNLTVVDNNCSTFNPNNAEIYLLSRGTQHDAFTYSTLPLASSGADTAAAPYLGVSASFLPLFKVDGNSWAITFQSNIGNLPPLQAKATPFLSQGASLTVYDNVVTGDQPLSYVISGASTGISYSARVMAYTRGPDHGYGPFSNLVASIPATVPDPVQSFSATPVVNVDEVQQLIIGASYMLEVQMIQTSAAAYPDEQLVSISVPVGGPSLMGNFSLRFPDIQAIQVKALTSLPAATYQLRYFYHDYERHGSALQNETTTCISLNAESTDIQSALEALTMIDSVVVEKSGYGGYTDYFGYVWTVSFVGNMVAGTVQLLEVVTGGPSCSPQSLFSGITLDVTRVAQNTAVGTDSEIQKLSLYSPVAFVQGMYRVSFEYPAGNIQLTPCIPWNATASQMTSALESLSNIDSVFVDLSDFGNPGSSYGFSYTVYLTGNALHLRNDTSSLGLLKAVSAPGTCPGYDFAYFMPNGVLSFASNTTYVFNSSVVQMRGFNLDAAASDAADLYRRLSLLPSFVGVNSTARSLSEDGFGFFYTIVFDQFMGDVPTMACGVDSTLSGIGGSCAPSTIIDGNYLRGYFIVQSSSILSADATATEMQTALNSAMGLGTVSVSRVGPDDQGGYSWFVTFLTAMSNIPPLTVSSLLTGGGASIQVTIVQPLNQVQGNYTLSLNGYVSSPIPYNASPALLTSILEAPTMNIGAVAVDLTGVTPKASSIYSITFLNGGGDVSLLSPNYANTLLGVNAVVKVIETTKGSVAEGTALSISYDGPLYCSHSQVLEGHCGSPIIGYSIDLSSSSGSTIRTVVVNETYDIQIIRTAAESLLSANHETDASVSGYFQLTYSGSTTAPINAHSSDIDLRVAIEALPTVGAVQVSRDYSYVEMGSVLVTSPGLLYVTCAASSCDFSILPPGELIRIDGAWYRVEETFSGDGKVLPLATAADASIPAFFNGSASASMPLYRWARGYEWAVTFLSTQTSPVEELGSPLSGLSPADATLAIRSPPCSGCTIISSLSSFTNYGLTIRAFNQFGQGAGYSIIGRPAEIPGAPSSITVVGNTGTSLLVTFTQPSGTDPPAKMESLT